MKRSDLKKKAMKFVTHALFLLGLAGPVCAGYYSGGTKVPHGHTSNTDGGVLGSVSITGSLTASSGTVTGATVTASGVFLAPDGSSPLPAYSFTNDTNTGMYRLASDVPVLVAGGTAFLTGGTAGALANSGLLLPDGSVGTPGLRFNTAGNQDNGIYRITTDDWGMSASGVLQLELNSSGVTFPTMTKISARPNAVTGKTSGTTVDVVWNSEFFDTNSELLNSTFTAISTGFYRIYGGLQVSPNTTGSTGFQTCSLLLRKNGALADSGRYSAIYSEPGAQGEDNPALKFNWLISLTAADALMFTIACTTNSAGTWGYGLGESILNIERAP